MALIEAKPWHTQSKILSVQAKAQAGSKAGPFEKRSQARAVSHCATACPETRTKPAWGGLFSYGAFWDIKIPAKHAD